MSRKGAHGANAAAHLDEKAFNDIRAAEFLPKLGWCFKEMEQRFEIFFPGNQQRRGRALSISTSIGSCYSHQELNLDQRFRKPLLYPFELWERAGRR